MDKQHQIPIVFDCDNPFGVPSITKLRKKIVIESHLYYNRDVMY